MRCVACSAAASSQSESIYSWSDQGEQVSHLRARPSVFPLAVSAAPRPLSWAVRSQGRLLNLARCRSRYLPSSSSCCRRRKEGRKEGRKGISSSAPHSVWPAAQQNESSLQVGAVLKQKLLLAAGSLSSPFLPPFVDSTSNASLFRPSVRPSVPRVVSERADEI